MKNMHQTCNDNTLLKKEIGEQINEENATNRTSKFMAINVIQCIREYLEDLKLELPWTRSKVTRDS